MLIAIWTESIKVEIYYNVNKGNGSWAFDWEVVLIKHTTWLIEVFIHFIEIVQWNPYLRGYITKTKGQIPFETIPFALKYHFDY